MWWHRIEHRYEPPRRYSYERQMVRRLIVLFATAVAVTVVVSVIVALVAMLSTALVMVQ